MTNYINTRTRPVVVPATTRQLDYLSSLLDARMTDRYEVTETIRAAAHAMQTGGITKRQASRWIDELRNMRPIADAPIAAPVTTDRPASERQVAFVRSLAGSRDPEDGNVRIAVLRLSHHDGDGPALTMPEASAMIDALRPMPQHTPASNVELAADEIDLRPLEAFTSRGVVRFAVPNGDTRLKVSIRFRRNGTIYVDDCAVYGHRQNYGMQRAGQGYRGAITDELRAIIADPQAAAIRYTELTGNCAVCNRHLEDKRSVAEGIGPVCSRRLGL